MFKKKLVASLWLLGFITIGANISVNANQSHEGISVPSEQYIADPSVSLKLGQAQALKSDDFDATFNLRIELPTVTEAELDAFRAKDSEKSLNIGFGWLEQFWFERAYGMQNIFNGQVL